MKIIKNTFTALGLSLGLMMLLVAPVSAHVVVRPDQALTSAFQTFTVGVPNEKGVPNTSVRLDIPKGLQHVTPTLKQGWQIDVQKDGAGEAAVVKSVTWSGNQVGAGFREEFSFSAKVPAEPAELQWKAYQTYADGQTVAWDLSESHQPKKADGSPDFSKSGPFSVTKIVSETEEAKAVKKAEQAATAAKKSASRAGYIAVAAGILGLAGIGLATRKK